MAQITCVNPSIDIFRFRGNTRLENYTFGSSVTFVRWLNSRIGGCQSAQFNVVRAVNEIGTLQKGDNIDIKYIGNLQWTGYVNDFVSRDGDLEIRCTGAWAGVASVFPKNAIYGTDAGYAEAASQNEYNDITTAKEILEHLYDGWLASSDISKVGLAAASPTHQESRRYMTGTDSFASIAQSLALSAGDWGVGVDENLDFYLVDSADLAVTEFKTCEDATFRITSMEKQESIAWVDYPTKITVVGDGLFTESFTAEDFGYPSQFVKIAGIILVNPPKVVVVPGIGVTEEKTYSPINGSSDIEVTSIDAARYADGIFLGQSLDDPENYSIEASRVNTLLRPWVDRVRIFDNNEQNRGVFVVEFVEYESEDADISISEMEVKKFHATS